MAARRSERVDIDPRVVTQEQRGAEATVTVLIVDVGGRRCALPAHRVVEIHPAVRPTPLPGAPAAVLGLVNRRGEPVPVIDVRRRMGLPTRPIRIDDNLVVVESEGRKMALPVDTALELSVVGQHDIDVVIDMANEGGDARISRGVAVLPDGLAVIADIDAFLSSEESVALNDAMATTVAPT